MARIDGREEVCEALRETGFGGVQDHAHDDGLCVVVDEGRTERRGAPDGEGRAEGFVGAEASDREDPGDFEEDGTEAGEGLDVAELTVFQADFFVEAEDSCVAELEAILLASLEMGQGKD